MPKLLSFYQSSHRRTIIAETAGTHINSMLQNEFHTRKSLDSGLRRNDGAV